MYRPIAFLKKWAARSDEHGHSTAHTADGLTDAHIRAIYAAASWLIDYPGDELYGALGAVRDVVTTAEVPAGVASQLLGTVEYLQTHDQIDVCAQYVETFDTRRRGCLFLTYFTHGDTRRRGNALLEIKQAYSAAGLDVEEQQLPDHLTHVLEFAAGHDLDAGVKILLKNRAGLELLRLHLNDVDSPWAGVVTAVCATLTPLSGDDVHAVERLLTEGPDEEEVGLDGYDVAPPMTPPPVTAQPSSRTTFIPVEHVVGARP